MVKKSGSQQPEMDEARQAALNKAVGDITKRYGDGAIMRLGEAHQLLVESIPTGSLSLDIALGLGGVPKGRITEIYGPESSRKTTICQHIVAEAQKLGGTAAYIDMEHALDPNYASRCGVDVENLLISQPDMGEAGDRDAQRFYPEMGTLYLTRIGEVIAACLLRHLEAA